MQLGPYDYVPILKSKPGEKAALQAIPATAQKYVAPLIEIVELPKSPERTVAKHLDIVFKQLAESLRPYPRSFIDTRELAEYGPNVANQVFERARSEGIVSIPVTGVSRIADVKSALKNRENGLALRATRRELEDGHLDKKLEEFVSIHKVDVGSTDLILDLGSVGDMISEGVAALARHFIHIIPMVESWRSLVLSSCAFPESMGLVERDSHRLVAREDWIAWRNYLYEDQGKLPRLPTYSDCAIQHPKGVEGFDPKIMRVSAAIRYLSGDHWLLIKGQSTKTQLPSVQFPQLAAQLVSGSLNPHYAGPSHCAGCESIRLAADKQPKHGAPLTWRRIGTTHHITSIIEDLRAIASP